MAQAQCRLVAGNGVNCYPIDSKMDNCNTNEELNDCGINDTSIEPYVTSARPTTKKSRKKVNDGGDCGEVEKKKKKGDQEKDLLSVADAIRQLSKQDIMRLEKKMNLGELDTPCIIELLWVEVKKMKTFVVYEGKCYINNQRETVSINFPARLEQELQKNTIFVYLGRKDDANRTHKIYLHGKQLANQKEMEMVAKALREKSVKELETAVTIKGFSDFSVSFHFIFVVSFVYFMFCYKMFFVSFRSPLYWFIKIPKKWCWQ
jgi:hypothetical protein